MARFKTLLQLVPLVAASSLASVASVHAQSPDATAPINCSTAEGDIRALTAEADYAKNHELSEAFALIPAGALLGILTGTEGKKLEMLSPEYQRRINERISEINEKCNLP
ncbi:MAG: hypothetical protein AAGF74_02180 [Pseudomonadota bacterium]